MAKSNMDQDILKVLITEDEIRNRTQELGDQLYDRFHDKNPMFVGVLNGCFIFMADGGPGPGRSAEKRGGVHRPVLL